MNFKPTALALGVAGLVFATAALASSHREAPGITNSPKDDNTDVYAFRSYEPGKAGNTTLIANFQPFEDPFGGPNYFLMDENAVYTINIDNNGDAVPDIAYEFRFFNQAKNITIPVNGVPVAIPLSNVAPFNENDTRGLNVLQYYTVTVVTPSSRSVAINPFGNTQFYPKPFDNIGTKSIANYGQYADAHIGLLSYAGCGGSGKTFVGQRKEGFKISVGKVFDLVNLNPVGPPAGGQNDLANKNVTSIALEVPTACLTQGTEPVVGIWSTVRRATNGVAGAQISRLGMPLVNEVVIGLPDKDKFNASAPAGDSQFGTYVTNPTLPALLEALFGVKAPTKFPRTDLVAAFLTGISGLNQPANVQAAEMLRLNTSIAPVAPASQNTLGVLGGDNAGFPNGRRPGDDVVDITLRVAMGILLTDAEAPSRNLPYTDGVAISALEFKGNFPYLANPIPGSAATLSSN